MYKRIISLILTLIMLITIVPSTIVAASEVRTMEGVEASGKQSECNRPEVDKSEENIIYMVNPLYEDVISIDDLKKKLDSSNDVQLFAASTGQYFSDYDSAVSYLRKQMVSRETEITLNFPASWFDSHKDELYWDLLYDAMKCDESSTGQDGDALIYGFAGCRLSYSNAGYIQYTMSYHSDAEQEAKLTAAVAEAMTTLQLNGLSEAKKIIKIHDYICNHVDYAYNSKEEQIYTAYGALCTGKAVCQGYAVLFYRLCKEAGLSVRIISGTGNGGAHAWNIVRIGSKYYNVDCTWDGQGAATYNNFLLKSEADFSNHTRKSWKVVGNHYLYYTSAEFNAQYPMTEKSWDESDNSNDSVETTYAHSEETSSGAVTLKAEWNDPVLGQPTTFHVSATGGSGKYQFRMDAPSYSSPNQWAFESVADPSRGEWMNYTSECASNDYTFTMTATGTYNFRFYVMDKPAGVYYLRLNFNIGVSDSKYPSVDSIVQSAVAECNSKTDGSEYAKALWLHDWLLDQLEYDNTLKWSSAESALTRKLGTCQSYESAYAKLLTAAGIENSETRDTYDGHTWNAMKLDGQWYQTDCTWDDSSDNWYSFDQRHLYFGLTDELMAIAHPGHSKIYTTDTYKTRSTSLADNYFVRSGDAEKWAKAYADRIQKNLDAGKTEFEITADNASYPPSISGIQNGITAYVLNQMKWSDEKHNISLSVTGSSNAFDFNIVYSDINHIWDNGTIIKEATCTEPGIKTYTCTICNKTKTETVAALGHSFSKKWIIDKPATCQNEGIKSYHCTRCNERQNVTTISKLDHEWDNGIIITEPTYTSEGKIKYTCKNCSFTKEVKTECLKETKEDKLARQNKNALKDGTYTIYSTLNNNFVLDIKNDSKADNGNVQLNQDNSSNSKEFIVTHDSTGYVTFTNANSGKVLDVSSGKAENRRNIQQYLSNGTKAQKWIVEKKENGYVIMSALNSDYVIDLSGGIISEGRNIQLYKSNDNKAQRWNFIYISKEDKLARQNKNALKDGTYTIYSTLNNNFVLDIKNDSKADNGNVQLNQDNSSNSKEFIVTHDSTGYVTFTNANSGKVLDVSSGKAENRRNIQQYLSNGTKAQKWIVEKKENGYVIMSALNSDYVIDLSGGIISEGRNIQLYQSNDSKAQRWNFY